MEIFYINLQLQALLMVIVLAAGLKEVLGLNTRIYGGVLVGVSIILLAQLLYTLFLI